MSRAELACFYELVFIFFSLRFILESMDFKHANEYEFILRGNKK